MSKKLIMEAVSHATKFFKTKNIIEHSVPNKAVSFKAASNGTIFPLTGEKATLTTLGKGSELKSLGIDQICITSSKDAGKRLNVLEGENLIFSHDLTPDPANSKKIREWFNFMRKKQTPVTQEVTSVSKAETKALQSTEKTVLETTEQASVKTSETAVKARGRKPKIKNIYELSNSDRSFFEEFVLKAKNKDEAMAELSKDFNISVTELKKYFELDIPLEKKGINIDTVLKMLKEGLTYRTIARQYGVKPEAMDRFISLKLNP